MDDDGGVGYCNHWVGYRGMRREQKKADSTLQYREAGTSRKTARKLKTFGIEDLICVGIPVSGGLPKVIRGLVGCGTDLVNGR